MVETGPEVSFAFALSFAAGLSTCLGGCILFFKCLLSVTKPASLGISLAVSAGVMVFISLTEIFNLSVHYFQEGFKTIIIHEQETTSALEITLQPILLNNDSSTHAIESSGHGEKECDSVCKGHGWSSASAAFLLGVLIIIVLDFIVHKLSPDTEEEFDPLDLEMLHTKDVEAGTTTTSWGGTVKDTIIANNQKDSKGYVENNHVEQSQRFINASNAKSTKKQLNRMGIMTALAVGIHNLPEGIATYIAAKTGSRLGAAMAIGIALHNIPEGVAIATPVYFATGSKLKAVGWTLLAGLAEPIGSIICWLVVGDGLDPSIEGVIYGAVSGMMITVSFKDLIPTSLKYNPNVSIFITSMLSGMGIMIVSLILFAYAGL